MKIENLLEDLFNRASVARDRGAERAWVDQTADAAAIRRQRELAQARSAAADNSRWGGDSSRADVERMSQGIWLWSGGRKLAGPFKDEEAALRFKANRPDRIPKDAVAKP